VSLERIVLITSLVANVLSISFSLVAIWHARRLIATRIKTEVSDAIEDARTHL
jgi:hypothetical protein